MADHAGCHKIIMIDLWPHPNLANLANLTCLYLGENVDQTCLSTSAISANSRRAIFFK
jgi:hypothetical protein